MAERPSPLTLGVIADTHNKLRPRVLERLAGVDHIVHAGDICKPQILATLQALAPLTAVRGNNDRGEWAADLPLVARLEMGGTILTVVHELKDLPPGQGAGVVISGHSHRPSLERRDGVLYLNPGSCGPRRFRLPVSMTLLEVAAGDCRVEMIDLETD